MTGCVYRCYDAAGRLLYVGSTIGQAKGRLAQHTAAHRRGAARSAWVVDVARVEVDQYPTWQEASVAEAALIAALAPLGNIQDQRAEWTHSRCIDRLRSEVIEARRSSDFAEAAS